MTKYGKENPNWRGGRLITPDGYVIIRVGKDHHLSDVRGYAYEHRLVAEEKLGRRLTQGEQIHHINEDRSDNRPENIMVVGGKAEHFIYHRKRKDLRLPGEPNPILECKCGCGETFEKYDSSGRPRRYVSGHNHPRPSTAQDEVLRILGDGSTHRKQIALICGKSIRLISVTLSKLKRKGLVLQVGIGIWALREKRSAEKIDG